MHKVMRSIIAPVLVVLSLLTLVQPATADISYLRAALYASCADEAPVYSVKDNGDLWLTAHTGARSGRNTWGTAKQIGTGWSGRVLAAPDGVLHAIGQDGTVKRFRWNGTGWDNGLGTVTGSGWGAYATGAGRDRITVDSDGTLFRLDGGLLWMHRFDGTRWSDGEVVDDGWGSYTSVVAAGSGVLYTRTADGAVYRHHLETASRTWVQRHLKTGRDLGTGRLFSAGGDTLYRQSATGDLVWQRFVPAKGEWVSADRTDGTTVGTGWTVRELAVAPDACSLRNPLKPVHQLMQLGLGSIAAGEVVTVLKSALAESGADRARLRVLAGEVAAYAQANWPAVEQAKSELDALLTSPNPEQALVAAARGKLAAAQGLELPQHRELDALLRKARAEAPKILQTIDQYRGFVEVFVDEGRKVVVALRDTAQAFREIPPFTLPADFKIDVDVAALEAMGRGWDQMNVNLTRMNESITASMAQLDASMASFNRSMDNFNSGMAEFDRSMTEFNTAMKQFNSGTPWWPPAGGFSLKGLKFDFDRVFPVGTTPEQREATDRKVSTLVGFVPFVGTGKGVADAINGRDVLTGEQLGGLDRAMNLLPMLRPVTQLMNGADAVNSAERMHDATRGNVVDGVRLNARLAGQEIAGGHAYQKHVVEQGEFPGVRTRSEFASLVENTIVQGEMRPLSGNRLGYWHNGMVVIRNPRAGDGGTAFAPRGGYSYFQNLH
jgi:hypothetical protein